jgi:hypothetical protein
LKDGGRFSFKTVNKGGDSYSATLQIKDLADSDAGSYRLVVLCSFMNNIEFFSCAIVNPFGKGSANFNLRLTGKLFLRHFMAHSNKHINN